VSPTIFEIVEFEAGGEIVGGIVTDNCMLLLVAAGVHPFETVHEYCPLSDAATDVMV